MKRFLKNFFNYFFGNPIFPTSVVICSVLIVFFTADNFIEPKEELPIYTYKIVSDIATSPTTTSETTTASTSLTSSTSKTTKTTASSTTVTSASVTSSTAPFSTEPQTEEETEREILPPVYSYISAGDSPNSDFYQDRLVVIGDSIAFGFNAYGYIPDSHNIAAESLGVWNMDTYSFDIGGGFMGIYDAISYANAPLYYLSIGMNDIYGYSPEDYAWNMRLVAEEILNRVPTATVVVGAITPVSEGNYYTDNDTIREFNYALADEVYDMNTSHVIFFNTHDVLCDRNTSALSSEYDGFDGLHLGSSAYNDMLVCLFNYLDDTPAFEQMVEHESS